LQESHPWQLLPQTWRHVELPGYREFEGTYGDFPISSLPPIPIELDEECQWLITHGADKVGGLNPYGWDLKPAAALEMAKQAGIALPRSFTRFMSSPELQGRVRSCTDCYLDPGERIIQTIGSIPGHLIHFLSDSQSCVHWYLHVLGDGRGAVLYSEDLYGYRITDPEYQDYPTCSLEEVDLEKQGFACCATSFPEFLFRFWIENEIWYALALEESRRPLKPVEVTYLNHYASKR
jgi:hypothetical protein